MQGRSRNIAEFILSVSLSICTKEVQECLQSSVKHSRGSDMVCSFISASGVGDLVKGDVGDLGRKTKQHYQS